jgi:hypothetical protein
MKPTKKVVASLTLVIVSILGFGVAIAAVGAWTSSANGTGKAKAQTMTFDVPAIADPTATTSLYPAGPGGNVVASVHNSNPYQITVTASASNGAVSASGGKGTCAGTGGSTVTYTPNGSLTVAPGATTDLNVATVVLADTTPDGCQGAVYAVPVTLTAVQSGT